MSVTRYWAVLVWSLLVWSGSVWSDVVNPRAANGTAQPGSVHRYELNAEPLVAFLHRFYQDQGQQVVFSDALQADKRTLNGIKQGQYAAIARSILASNELLAYHDGTQVYIYRRQDIAQRFFSVDPQQVPALRRALAHDLPGDQHNRTRVQTALGTVDASGIPRYLDQVQQLVNAVARRDEPEAFRYVALKYAWATDRSFTVGGQQVSVPGVATLLRELIGAPPSAIPQKPVDRRRATSVRESASASAGVTEQTAAFVQAATDSQRVPAKPGGRIVADPARNAIMLRDTPARMRWYEELIQRLDVPTQIVEIEAAIIDVNTDKLQEVGVEWRLARDRWEVMSAQSGSKLGFLSALVQDSVVGMQQLPGFQVGAIIGDRHQFISRLNLLEQDGVLKVASRPKVVTLNDLEAVIESSRTLYVPVQGAYEVDLFEVIAGTILRVTPHVIHDDGQSRIRMTLAIEDGTVDMLHYGKNGNDVPVSTRHAVNTQAIINAGHSLLLGGLVRDEEVTSVQKVPLLGSLPLIGTLFRSESTSVRKSERMFLLSPRLVTLGSEGIASAEPLSAYSPSTRQWLQRTCQGNCSEEYGSQGMQFY